MKNLNKEDKTIKEFNYVIKDELGIHARPAGLLVKEAGKFSSKVTVAKGEKEVDAKRLIGLMSLGVKKNDELIIKVEGEDEDACVEALKVFLENNL